MNIVKLLAGGAAVAVILLAFRDFERGGWLPPGGRAAEPFFPDEEEPVLGYDGMDRDTLIQWLQEAELDQDMLFRIHEYEATHQRRERVLETVADLMV